MYRLNKIYNSAYKINLRKDDKILIISDLHIGNGKMNDDFSKNSTMLISTLKNYYYPNDFKLIINGDCEELYKFNYYSIRKSWIELYELFTKFYEADRFYKIYGNHDYELIINKSIKNDFKIYESLLLNYYDNHLLIFHGHQTAPKFEQYSKIIYFIIKYLFRTISNNIEPIDSEKKFLTEKSVYQFSKEKQIISILGHTHRPLFESLSKSDSLKLTIENLIAKYLKSSNNEQIKIRKQIIKYKKELDNLKNSKNNFFNRNSIYDDGIIVPCLFNSGAVTGKRGFTGIEINNGNIALIYWFDINKSQRYLNYKGVKYTRLEKTDFYKATLKIDNLDYLFTRIKLLC